MIVPIERNKVLKTLAERGVVAVVGVYGSAKGLITEWLSQELSDRGNKVVRVSLKDLPKPAEGDIPQVFGRASWALLHNSLRRQAQGMKSGKYLVIVIEEAQQLMENGDKLWEMLASLRYYQREKVKIIMAGQPLILSPKSIHLRRLLMGSVHYPRQLRESEVRAFLENNKFAGPIYRLSHGHFGSVKYVAQLVEENDFDGERLTESRVIKWAKERGEMDYFVQKVWEGMSSLQQRQLRQYLINHGKIAGEVQELIETGILWRGGGRLSWCVPWTLPFVLEFVGRQSDLDRVVSEEELQQLGERGRRFLRVLLKHKNEVVAYTDLADVIWGDEGNYSLWALSRLAGRVRTKLAEMGYGGLVGNVRGVGYKWVD